MSDEPPGTSGLAVLLVEDDGAVRGVIEIALAEAGYNVLAVSNAYEALEVFDQGKSFDLLISDVAMPGMSGPQLAERIKASQPNLKTLLMSGYAMHRRGVTPFLQKPFMPDELNAKIAEILFGDG